MTPTIILATVLQALRDHSYDWPLHPDWCPSEYLSPEHRYVYVARNHVMNPDGGKLWLVGCLTKHDATELAEGDVREHDYRPLAIVELATANLFEPDFAVHWQPPTETIERTPENPDWPEVYPTECRN